MKHFLVSWRHYLNREHNQIIYARDAAHAKALVVESYSYIIARSITVRELES